MKINEILKREGFSLSFEVFPPKTDVGFDSVKAAVEEIAKLCPAYLSVTYGAGGGTSKYTLEIAESVKKEHGVPTLAHLTCVSSSRDTVRGKIAAIKAAGIENVMALRGDIPESMLGTDRSKWDYTHAYELVRELREAGDFLGFFCENSYEMLEDGQVFSVFKSEILSVRYCAGHPQILGDIPP